MGESYWIPFFTSGLALIGALFNFAFTYRLTKQKSDHEARLVSLTARVQVNSTEEAAAIAGARQTIQTEIAQLDEAVVALQRIKDACKVVIHGIDNRGHVDRDSAINEFLTAAEGLRLTHNRLMTWLPTPELDVVHRAYNLSLKTKLDLRLKVMGTVSIDYALDGVEQDLDVLIDGLRNAQMRLRELANERQEKLSHGLTQ